MKKREAVAIGDVHLDGMNSVFPDLDTSVFSFQMLNAAVDYCNRHSIDTMIQLGDISDTPYPPQRTIKKFTRWNANNPDLDKHFIPGNHDVASVEDNSMELFKDILELSDMGKHTHIYMEPEEKWINGIPYYFLPHPHTKPPKADYPRMCVGHFAASGTKRDSGMTEPNGVDIKVGKDFYLMGHLHRLQYYKKRRLLYPGTMYQRNFGEPLPKGFSHLTMRWSKSALKVNHTFVPLTPPFVLHNVRATDLHDAQAQIKVLREAVAREPQPPILKVKLLLPKGFPMAPSFLTDHPEIHRHLRFKTEAEANAFARDELDLQSIEDAGSMDVLELLKEDMRERKVSKEIRREARGILKTLCDRNGIELVQ